MRKKFFKKGFTLPEAIIAAAVLAIAVVAMMQVFPAGIRTTATSRKRTVATNLAQAAIEQNISQPYNDIISVIKHRVSENPSSNYYDYYQQINVVYVDANLAVSGVDTGLKKVTATIYWPEGDSEKTVVIPTLISNK